MASHGVVDKLQVEFHTCGHAPCSRTPSIPPHIKNQANRTLSLPPFTPLPHSPTPPFSPVCIVLLTSCWKPTQMFVQPTSFVPRQV